MMLDFGSTNSSPLYASPHPQSSPPNGSPLCIPLRTAYAWGCGAEAATRVGAWAGLGGTQCKAAGDWPSAEGKRTLTLTEVWTFLFVNSLPMSLFRELFVGQTHGDMQSLKVALQTVLKRPEGKQTSAVRCKHHHCGTARALPGRPVSCLSNPSCVYKHNNGDITFMYTTNFHFYKRNIAAWCVFRNI